MDKLCDINYEIVKPVLVSSELNLFEEVDMSCVIFQCSEIVFGVKEEILKNVEEMVCVEIKPVICEVNFNVFENVVIEEVEVCEKLEVVCKEDNCVLSELVDNAIDNDVDNDKEIVNLCDGDLSDLYSDNEVGVIDTDENPIIDDDVELSSDIVFDDVLVVNKDLISAHDVCVAFGLSFDYLSVKTQNSNVFCDIEVSDLFLCFKLKWFESHGVCLIDWYIPHCYVRWKVFHLIFLIISDYFGI